MNRQKHKFTATSGMRENSRVYIMSNQHNILCAVSATMIDNGRRTGDILSVQLTNGWRWVRIGTGFCSSIDGDIANITWNSNEQPEAGQ